ncbi:hypothetical protein F5146DRAFT_1136801 [Armillaria mellea]|nr:hypothetical protein F5146DRAFT_1136801 [Armillaria mellea]
MFSDVRRTFSVDPYLQVLPLLAYPWRGTTPLTCIFFVGLTILLVFVNIPLSAYDIVQVSTYYPNDTSQSLPFANFLPASLRYTAGDFTAQTFKIGDTIQSNLSAFNYVIAEAFDSDGYYPVGSFSYYNNPLSSCDVSNITLTLRKEKRVSLYAVVSCWIPINYEMTLTLDHANIQDLTFGVLHAVADLDGILTDLEYGWDSNNITMPSNNGRESASDSNQNVTGLDVSVFPCCVCGNPFDESYIGPQRNSEEPLLSLVGHPPCDNDEAKFRAAWFAVYDGQGSYETLDIMPDASILPVDQELEVPSNVQLVLQNALQAIYHTIRLDLGVIRPNQVFISASMFNESISSVPLFNPDKATTVANPELVNPSNVAGLGNLLSINDSFANEIRRLMSTMDPSFFYQNGLSRGPLDVRVPSISYLQPIFRRKPMASAISSVFVATFAMASAAWSLFHFIAGSFCRTQTGTQIYYVIDTQLSNAVAQMYLVVRIAAIVQVNILCVPDQVDVRGNRRFRVCVVITSR